MRTLSHDQRVAKKVEYTGKYLNVGDSLALADHFTRAKLIDLTDLCWRLVYIKHNDWKYENEWRCYWPLLQEPVGTGFDDHVQDPRLFEAIYLGCNMTDDEASTICTLARRCLPDTAILRAKKSLTSFDLEFDEI